MDSHDVEGVSQPFGRNIGFLFGQNKGIVQVPCILVDCATAAEATCETDTMGICIFDVCFCPWILVAANDHTGVIDP